MFSDNFSEKFSRRIHLTPQAAYQDFLHCMLTAANSDFGYLHLVHAKTKEIELQVWSDETLKICQANFDAHYPIANAGIWADAIRIKQPIIVNDYQALPQTNGLPDGHFPLHRFFSIPVIIKNQVVAVMGAGNAQLAYNVIDVEKIQQVVQQYWPTLEKKINHIKTNLSQIDLDFKQHSSAELLLNMVESMSRALEMRDEYTAFHQRNVAFIAVEIAKVLNFSLNRLYGLHLAGLLHDIGKITIPTQLLNKPNRLSLAEFNLLKTHAENGRSIFRDVYFPWPINIIIHQHHERLDGSGYPQGLKGEQISIEAQIIAVADVYDAMANARPYRRALGHLAAYNFIRSNREKLFRADVVDAFVTCYRNDFSFSGRYGSE